MGFLIAGGIIIIIGGFWIMNYNGLIKLRGWKEESWSQIDVQLKRRYDLIPNLVNTAKTYMKHERSTLAEIVEKRNQITSPDLTREEQVQADNQLSGALRQFFSLTEAYPDLKANESFSKLHEDLVATENKVAYSKQLYNKTVMQYNNKVESFPSNLIASVHNFRKHGYLEATNEERQSVKVDFD
ncbi:LemA family protein [Alkalicoccobacillus plakortidis]|uniref:LemA family protein n=1 Tax=Alkalicoccobacillus plakortidis TaxID=444060 RepID=A0ABT0XN82_9BACI|nr:LemA family protein [Alkalicoccobacillus plakortidis]MCM2676692.1 LemA family protein [Alkalicoccobacillus plakortidis]